MHTAANVSPLRLLIATGNKGKQREFQQLLAPVTRLPELPMRLVLPDEAGVGGLDVPEDGETLEANATLKARAYARASGLYALADDSGLYVDALDGRPGIYAARYGGPGSTEASRRRKLLDELMTIPEAQRTAHFACVIALGDPQTGECVTVHGVCPGRIATQEHGASGFGYDPIFIPNGYTRTFAEIADEDEANKNEISHRGDAAHKMLPILIDLARRLTR